jgi:hypothetical protein
MKLAWIAIALIAGSASVCAFAQTETPAQLDNGTPQAASNNVAAAPYGQPTEQKTRAQVYQELVQAERDGQMAYLDSTVYAHP